MESNHATRQPQWSAMLHNTFILVSLSITSLFVVLNVSFITCLSAAKAIIQNVGGTSIQVCAMVVYLIACMVAMPNIESIRGIFGQHDIVLPCIGLFTLVTALCCISNGIALKIAGCPVQVPGDRGVSDDL
ncbi:hypothetical protein LZ30DRAFT_396509 [Colletotrichum cereale]|nr:hypothetical protein LZ30DRAFT_396509 [Colletotrichum cereale]